MSQEVFIKACTREMFTEIAYMRDSGLTDQEIAARSGFHKQTVSKYLRLGNRYGTGIFISQQAIREFPEKKKRGK